MRWKELPESLDPHAWRLVVELRRLKDHSGLSLKSLQAKTPFSKSSWERYLNGKALPPQDAVEALAGMAGADGTPLLALRDAAQRTSAADAVTSAESGPPAHRQDPQPEIRVAALSVATGALLLSAVTSVLLIVGPGRGQPPAAGVAGVGKYGCTYTRHGDQLFAGNSTTTSHLVMRNGTGPDVAEVQCLLLRHELSPGDVDGYFGERTEAEVRRLQRRDHVADDGMVGELTWALLRHVA
ncbi:peptidoglycan-binding protein [Streptomyces shenzhenensis]|uniref:peptidoglycan-binding protein n=1 Tax=Streptomyces shenzhenensis TaxID=943815 RepID=UPI002867BA0C|nr:peptidoglycan-binding protein [Streptomyces shenzhenensis]